MKRFVFLLAALSALSAQSYAQGEMDALKVAQGDIMGTARYMAMGGAFTALGGDASAIINNPAGLGVYRSTEISFTPNIYYSRTNSESATNTFNDNYWNFNFNNFAFIGSFRTGRDKGLISSNFSLSYNRLKDYHNNTFARIEGSSSSVSDYMALVANQNNIRLGDLNMGFDYAFDGTYPFIVDLGWQTGLINPYPSNDWDPDNTQYQSFLNSGETCTKQIDITESGSLDEWNFSYAGNINNIVYFGGSIGLQSFNYRMKTSYDEYYNNGEYFHLYNNLHTTGIGLNMKVGAIVRPADFLRLGVAFHTPTYYAMTDNYDADASSYVGDYSSDFSMPWGTAYYNMYTPYKVMGGIGFIIGQKAIVSADYEMNDYSYLKYGEEMFYYGNDYNNQYSGVNDDIKSDFQIVHKVRVGAEFRVTDMFSVRAGYAFSTPPVKSSVEKDDLVIYTAGTTTNYSIPKTNNYFSAGIGLKKNRFFFDVAYMLNLKTDNLYMHPMSEPVETTSYVSNLACTFGWRF